MRTGYTKHAILIAAIIGAAIAVAWLCRPKSQVKPTFYYWRTVFKLSEREKQWLASERVDELYVRFFDVDIDPVGNAPQPVGKIVFADSTARQFGIIPVVFVTNRVFKQLSLTECDSLAHRTMGLIQRLVQKNRLSVGEIQMDCDWSETTRDKYFRFLTAVKAMAAGHRWPLSATIRLHQVKYPHKTGIPPVDRGMLMFYNMGNLEQAGRHNSIYNSRDAVKYVSSIKAYALPLDVALPAFSWAVHQRDGKTVGLLNQASRADFEGHDWLRETAPLVYEVVTPVFSQGRYFKQGDQVCVETVTPALTLEAAKLLSANIHKESRRIAIFRLDSLTLQPYEKEDFKAVFDCFR